MSSGYVRAKNGARVSVPGSEIGVHTSQGLDTGSFTNRYNKLVEMATIGSVSQMYIREIH